MSSSSKRAPPQLMFDDGSRIMAEETIDTQVVEGTPASIRGAVSLEEYYEIDRVVEEVLAEYNRKEDKDGLLRVALQFPDELLDDSPEVCWMLEEHLSSQVAASPLVFCLGDTTVGSCCPDEVAALHLNADILVHYGHACLSPTGTLPVVYSFGQLNFDVQAAIECLKNQDGGIPSKILLLYQVGYQYAMPNLQRQLEESAQATVVVGRIPLPTEKKARVIRSSGSCCGGNDNGESCCKGDEEEIEESEDVVEVEDGTDLEAIAKAVSTTRLSVGGLELPSSISSWEVLPEYTVLFVGESESTSQKQFVNIMLQFMSLSTPPTAYWAYSPNDATLSTNIPRPLQKQLNRRFFLSQKARDAQVFGILVSNLSQQHLVDVVKVLKRKIQDEGKTSYSFAVGKINQAKLANFAEIECFVLVACREHSLLANERDYPIPVITPLELDVALGNAEWGSQPYSLDCQDALRSLVAGTVTKATEEGDSDVDADAPYFSLVTGKYVQKASKTADEVDLTILPGQGQVTAYNSEAAKFLSKREFQGLETQAGQTEAKAAVVGQRGIASDYSGI